MHDAHIEVLAQLLIGDVGIQIRRKRLRDVVVNTGMIVSIDSRQQHNTENCQPDLVMLCDKGRYLIHLLCLKERFVSGLLDRLVKDQDHGRKQGNTAEHTDDNAL